VDNEQLYTALRNAHAAGDVEGARKLAAYIQTQPTAQAVEKPKGGDSESSGRNAAIAGRAAWNGAASIADLAADPFGAVRRMFTGEQSPLQQAPDTLLKGVNAVLGGGFNGETIKPETSGEKMLDATVSGATGALAGPGGGLKSAATALMAGAGAGAGGELAKEGGGGTLSQIFASLLGGLAPQGVAAGLGAVARGARNVVEPMTAAGAERSAGRLASEVAGPNREAIINELIKAQSGVPNLRLNAGQAATPVGSAEFSALQKTANDIKPTPAAALESSQEAARRSAIQSIGQDKPALEAAIAKRGADAKANYGAAYQAQISADPELAQIASNPYYRDAVPEALKMAKAKGLDPKTGLTEYLQGVKLVLDDKLRKAGEGALGDSQKKLVSEVKGQLVDWLGKKNQLYDKARTEFSAASKPINQMQVGQYLEDKLVAPLENADRAGSFATAMRDAPRTIKNSTGQSMYDDLGKVLTPQQEQVANAVLGNLKNEAVFNDLASKGASATRKMVGDFSQPVQGVGMVDRVVTVANAILRRVEGKGSKATMNSLADLMQDPQKLATVMGKATPSERQTLVDALAKASAGTVGAQ